jgi:uncharacterized coiled-coil protein SlyX
MMEHGMDNRRLELLETKFSYIEKNVADLDTLVIEYGRRMERLEAMIPEMLRRLAELGAEKDPDMPAGERPPHY